MPDSKPKFKVGDVVKNNRRRRIVEISRSLLNETDIKYRLGRCWYKEDELTKEATDAE